MEQILSRREFLGMAAGGLAALVGCVSTPRYRESSERPQSTYHYFATGDERPVIRGERQDHLVVTVYRGNRYTSLGNVFYVNTAGNRWEPIHGLIEYELHELRSRKPVIVGNDGLPPVTGTTPYLGELMKRVAQQTGVASSISPTPFIGDTTARIVSASREHIPIIGIGYSAGCRDLISAIRNAERQYPQLRIPIVDMIEPTYQLTHGYTTVPASVESLVCLRIRGGDWHTFSGRAYEPKDFANRSTTFTNKTLDATEHLRAWCDPQVFNTLLEQIDSFRPKKEEKKRSRRAVRFAYHQ